MGAYTLGCFLVICTKTSRQWDVASEETEYITNTTTNNNTNCSNMISVLYVYIREMINFGRCHFLRLFSMFFFILWLFMMQMYVHLNIHFILRPHAYVCISYDYTFYLFAIYYTNCMHMYIHLVYTIMVHLLYTHIYIGGQHILYQTGPLSMAYTSPYPPAVQVVYGPYLATVPPHTSLLLELSVVWVYLSWLWRSLVL